MKNRRRLFLPLMTIIAVLSFALTGVQTSRAEGENPREAAKNKLQTTGGSNTTNRVELRQKVGQKGTIRVLVTLNLAYSPEAGLDPAGVQTQRTSIERTTQNLLASMAGQKYTLNATYYAFPLVGVTVDSAGLEKLFTSPYVSSVAESTMKKADLAQSVPLIGASNAQAQGYDGTGYAVAILDTGFQTTHPFLAGRTVSEACFSRNVVADGATTLCPNGQQTSGSTPGQTGTGAAANCSATIDGCEHGTHVAGITLGKNYSGGPGYNGVAPGANLIAIQVFSKITSVANCSPSPSPCLSAYDEDIIAALQYVQGLSGSFAITSINMSLGDGVNNTSACDSSPYFAVVASLRTANIATAIAAGNEGYTNGISGPACVSNSISVGSTTKADAISSFSNRASFMSLWAPGSAITASVPTNAYDNLSGTSMATPHVAGAWASMRQRFPTETVSQILTRLQNTGVTISGSPNPTVIKRIRIDSAMGLATATPTNTSPAPTASSTAPAVAYMIQDGSLEAGTVSTYWTQTSTNFGTPICDASCGGVGPRTGTYWAWFGGTSAAETGSLQQVKKIAPGPKALTFYLWWSSSVGSPPDPAAYFRVRMDGNIIFSLTPATAAAYNAAYTYVSVDISAYADDGTHTLRFEQGNVASSAATNVHLDDINFVSISGGGPTNTPTRTNTPTNTATNTNTAVPPRPDTIGVYNGGLFYLRNTNNTGGADINVAFGGDVSDLPVAGDWNGDGVDTIGIYRSSTGFYFLSDSNTSPAVNYTVLFGNPGDTPFAGKWINTMTHDGLGVYRNSNGILYQKTQLITGFSDYFAIFGNPGDQGFAGDWDNNGFDSIGVYRSSNTTWFMTNNSTPGGITFSDYNFVLDITTSLPVAGDWDGDGDSTPGWLTAGGVFSLHPNNSIVGPDNVFAFGPANSKPIAGKWIAGSQPGLKVFNPNAPGGGFGNENIGGGD